MIKNRYFRTGRQTAAAFTMSALVLLALTGLTLAVRYFLYRSLPEVGPEMMAGLPVGMLFAVSLILLMGSLILCGASFVRRISLC